MIDMKRQLKKFALLFLILLAGLHVYELTRDSLAGNGILLLARKSNNRDVIAQQNNDAPSVAVTDRLSKEQEIDERIKDKISKLKKVDLRFTHVGVKKKTEKSEASKSRWRFEEEQKKIEDMHYDGHDILEDPVPDYDPAFKNPCWFEKRDSNSAKRTPRLRCLPYVYIIGVKKCGTSDLFSRLSKHPDFAYPGFKEAQFFARGRFGRQDDDIDEYIGMFDEAAAQIMAARRLDNARRPYNNWTITAEASPSNLHLNSHWKRLPGNEHLDEPKVVILDYIRHLLPSAKIIILFRDPVERLYSDYYHEYGSLKPNNNPNPGEFHDIVTRGLKLYEECFAKRSVRSCVYDPDLYGETKIQIQLGIYYVFWEELTRVYPRDQILVLQNRQLRDKQTTMASVYRFLDMRKLTAKEMDIVVSEEEKNTMEKHNNTRIPMQERTSKLLQEFYRPFNIEFAEIMSDPVFLYNQDLTKSTSHPSRTLN